MYINHHCDREFFIACRRNILKNENMPQSYKDICKEWFMLHSTEPVTSYEIKSEILWNKIFITNDRSPLNDGEW